MGAYRGDIFYVDFAEYNSPAEMERRPGRPAIIVSCDANNEHSPNVTVVYLTTQEKPPMPTHVEVICKVPSTALCEQVYTVPKVRLGTYVRTCTHSEMQQIDKALASQFGLSVHEERAAELEARLLMMEETAEKAAENGDVLAVENAKLQAERDTYKHMYELLMDKLLTR